MPYCWHSHRKHQYEYFRVFACQSEDRADDSRRVGWVQWWLRRYDSSEASFWSDRSDKKITHVILGEIHDIINNHLGKSIISVAWDVRVSSNAWRDSLFLTQDEKGPIFSAGFEGQEKRLQYKAFQQTQLPPPPHWTYFTFSQTRKNSARIRWWTYRTTVGFVLFPQGIPIVIKTQHSTSWYLGRSVATIKFCLHSSFLHGLRLNKEAYIKYLEVVPYWIERVVDGRP